VGSIPPGSTSFEDVRQRQTRPPFSTLDASRETIPRADIALKFDAICAILHAKELPNARQFVAI
jgi:hypothetical protein